MKDAISLGPVPTDEKCESLGPQYDPMRAKKECNSFVGQLTREHGEPPPGVRFKITSNRHDFGTYYDVEIEFEEDDEFAVEYALMVEGDLPFEWDDISKAELF